MYKLNILDFIDSDNRKKVDTSLNNKTTYSPADIPGELVFRRKDCTLFPAENDTKLYHTKNNNFFIAYIKDITQRKQTEEIREKEKEQLAVTLSSIGDGVIATDVSGKIILFNREAAHLTGWKKEEAIGKNLKDILYIIDEQSRLRCENPIARVMRSGTDFTVEKDYILVARDCSETSINNSASPLTDKKNKIIGAVIVFRDTSERHRMQAELNKAQRLESLGILAGGIAHDFNNILTAIMGNISLSKMNLTKEDKIYQFLDSSDKACDRAKDLTQQLLTFSKGGAPIKKATALDSIIKESADFSLVGSNVRAVYNFPNDLWHADIDRTQFSQVIQNLTINSSHAMPEGGQIEISCSNEILPADNAQSLPDGHYVKIIVKDYGTGIPEKYIKKIFDPYYTTKQLGHGLGLSITYSIINKHGGHIAVDSIPGEGTTFIIHLQASQKLHTHQVILSANEVPNHARVLFMDDETMIRDIAQAVLTRSGYTVTCVIDGEHAIKSYHDACKQNTPYDLIIMDLTIPGAMGGQETLDKLLQFDQRIKAIVISGYSNHPVMANYQTYGFKDCVTKPFTAEKLIKVVGKVLRED